ncbi:MAG: hypothetical protein E7426_05270 [Ruminococcaceae bacterium]|nr:hypothetical protein [Oscillospiraceae bacterium]
MKLILFQIHFCGMSMKDYSKKILIYSPFRTLRKLFSLKNCSLNQVKTASDLVSRIKQSEGDQIRSVSGEFGVSCLSLPNVYIEHKGYLFGLKHDKSLSEIISQFNKALVIFHIFIVPGGASREHHGYKFIIHSDESIHKYSPHVHVEKSGISTRYSLVDFKRYPNDKYSTEHIRDEKKVIIPYLKENHKWFIEKWNLSMMGYIPPVETLEGQQICRES